MAEQKETAARRIARLENIAVAHDASIEALIEAGSRTERKLAELAARMAELREESNEREKRMDERVDKLVSAIGEFIRQRNGN